NSCSHDGCACTSAEVGTCVCGEDHSHVKNASVGGEASALYDREKGDDGRVLSSEQAASNRPADTSVVWKSHAVEEPHKAEPAACSNCGEPREPPLLWFFYGGGKRKVVVLGHMVGKVGCKKFPKKPREVYFPDNKEVKTITKSGILKAAKRVSTSALGFT
ncbi:unnamed protein product, partial [Ectocarpus sp. 12 AP-2014]